LGSEVSMVSPNLVSPLIHTTVMPLQSSPDHTPFVEGDVSHILVIKHPLQPMVEEVDVPVQSMVNQTLLMEGDASFNHVFIIHYSATFEQERVILSLSTLPSSLEEVSFRWYGLAGYPMSSPMSFPVIDII